MHWALLFLASWPDSFDYNCHRQGLSEICLAKVDVSTVSVVRVGKGIVW